MAQRRRSYQPCDQRQWFSRPLGPRRGLGRPPQRRHTPCVFLSNTCGVSCVRRLVDCMSFRQILQTQDEVTAQKPHARGGTSARKKKPPVARGDDPRRLLLGGDRVALLGRGFGGIFGTNVPPTYQRTSNVPASQVLAGILVFVPFPRSVLVPAVPADGPPGGPKAPQVRVRMHRCSERYGDIYGSRPRHGLISCDNRCNRRQIPNPCHEPLLEGDQEGDPTEKTFAGGSSSWPKPFLIKHARPGRVEILAGSAKRSVLKPVRFQFR